MKKNLSWLGLIILLLLALSACSPEPASQASTEVVAQPSLLIAEGRVMPVNWLDQSFSVPGLVAEVMVLDGDTIEVGQVLARLADAPELQSALTRSEQEQLAALQALDELEQNAGTRLADARLAVFTAQEVLDDAQDRFDLNDSEENRLKLDQATAQHKYAKDALAKLEDGGGIDPDQLAAAEARITAAEAAVASAQSALAALELKSTLSGAVIDLDLKAGQRVTAGAPVITLADLSSWVVKTDNLTEIEVVQIEIGQPVMVVLDALPDVPLAGEVTAINSRFEEKRGEITYTVTVALNDTDPRLRWGMTAAVEFGE
jgi:HlyD family secretion protein